MGPESWFIFLKLDISASEVMSWLKDDKFDENGLKYKVFKSFVSNMICVNDCAERNIRLIQDFVKDSRKDGHLQNILQVVKKHRKKVTKEMTKTQELCLDYIYEITMSGGGDIALQLRLDQVFS